MEDCIDVLDIFDEHGLRVICKGLEILEEYLHAVEICIYVIW